MKIPCHQLIDPNKWTCSESCDTRLNCGHQCLLKCHIRDDPSHVQYLCKKNCARSCINDHPCKKKHPCHTNCDPCKIYTKKTLDCGHQVNVSCSENIENWRCEELCQRETLSCGHKCMQKCFISCNPCIVSRRSYATTTFYFYVVYVFVSAIDDEEVHQLSAYHRSSVLSDSRKIEMQRTGCCRTDVLMRTYG